MKDRFTNSTPIPQSIIKRGKEAMPQIGAGSLSKSSIDPAIVKCIINEVEANH